MKRMLMFLATLALLGFENSSGIEPLFDTPLDYAVDKSASSVLSSDLDGDSDKDLAVTCFDSNNVSVLFNNGDGTFQAAVKYAVGITPYSAVAADLDGDGDADLAVANYGSNNVSILMNNGNGTFQPAVNYATATGPILVSAADLDGDYDIDLAVANRASNNVSVLMNNGGGTFQTAVNYGAGSSPYSLFATDLDGDGDADLAVANYGSNNVSILTNNGDGTFQTAVNYAAGSHPVRVFAADLDGDNDKDLAVSNFSSNNVSVLISNGDGSFLPAVNYGVGTGPYALYVADLDGDNDNDLVTANLSSNNVSVLENVGDGTFQSAANYGTGSRSAGIFAADLDSDGYKDLAVTCITYGANDKVLVFRNKGDGTFPALAYCPVGFAHVSICAADIDGDKDNDLLTGILNPHMDVLFNNGDRTFRPAVAYYNVANPKCIFPADLDGDGDIDVAVAAWDGVLILINDGSGTFQLSGNYSAGYWPASIFAADLEGDQDNDLVTADSANNAVWVLLNNSNGTFQAAVNYPCGSSPMSVFVADLDNDGDKDLAAANLGSDNVSILENNGNGTFQTALNYPAGSGPYNLFAADLDGDGDNDIAVTNQTANTVSILFNDGTGVFQSPVSYSVGAVPRSIFAGDIDGDGDNDILSGNFGSGNITVLYNDGLGSFTRDPLPYPAGDHPVLCASDLDNDYDLDVATTDETGQNVNLLFNIGALVLAPFDLLSPAASSVLTSNLPQVVWSPSRASKPGYVVDYTIYWSDNAGFSDPDSVSGISDTVYIFGEALPRSHSYWWYVKGHTDTRFKCSSDTFSFYIDGYPNRPEIVGPPNGIYADTLTYLTWLVATDPDSFDVVSYTVQVDDDSLFGSPEISSTLTAGVLITDNSISVRIRELDGYQDLVPDTRYNWRLRSNDSFGLSSTWTDSLCYFYYLYTNHPPNPPVSGFSPADYEEVISLTPTISWDDAADPDPDDYSDNLRYVIELFSDSSMGDLILFANDTTAPGINRMTMEDSLPDNFLFAYLVKTIDDGGLESGWSEIQHFWTNHYNFPPEPFPIYGPPDSVKQVVYYTHFSWGSTVDYDPNSSFRFTLQYSPDTLFYGYVRSISGLTDTALAVLTDSLAVFGQHIYWRVLAVDDDSLMRIGGLPQEDIRLLNILPPGDANSSGHTDGIDVVYLVNYFKGFGPRPDPLLAGDENANCTTNGIDVTYLVNYLKGIGPRPVRPACGPEGVTPPGVRLLSR